MCRSPVILPAVVMRGTAAALVLVGALAGCSADAEPKPLPPLPSVSPTPVVPPVPPEATPETAQGASAFMRYFLEVVNRAYVARDASQVWALATENCDSCESAARDIDRLREADHVVPGTRYRLTFVATAAPDKPGEYLVDFEFDADPYVETDGAGEVVQEFPAQGGQVGQALLVRGTDGWRVDAIRLVD
jgi:hypothetical protein